MSDVYVLSTMTNAVTYRTYRFIGDPKNNQNQSLLPIPEPDPITIRGGANRPNQKGGFGDTSEDLNGNVLWTPRGVVTRLTQEQYDKVKEHWLFQKHLTGGFLVVLDKEPDHKRVKRMVEDGEINKDDKAAQLTKDTVAQRIKVKTPTKESNQEW
jgi:hypothetical protein